jgi:predicted nucleotidyltransferase component of viral defense system
VAFHLNTWEILFKRALVLIEDARKNGLPVDEWTFGGGTVLMRRHHHRLSKDVDIFVNDPQFIGFLSPRLSAVAESLTHDYVEAHEFVKLVFDEGEIDFVASDALTAAPSRAEEIFGCTIQVETSTEIVAKKIWHRGAQFTARDIFDLAMVSEREPQALTEIEPILQDRREVVLARIDGHSDMLRASFEALERLDYQRNFDECVEIVRQVLPARST